MPHKSYPFSNQRLSKPDFRLTRTPTSEYTRFPRLPEDELEGEAELLPPPVTKSNTRRRPSLVMWLMYKICTTVKPEYAVVALMVYTGGRRKNEKGVLAKIKEFFQILM
ncbi:hypothetical protein PMIN06_001825 [Paraphaeosphaeria minitans]